MKALLIIFVFLAFFVVLLYLRRNALKYVPQNNEEFARTLADKSVQLIDVRTPEEYAMGHMPGAKNINIADNDFMQEISGLDKNNPVAIYCRSGSRSKVAARKLASVGYKVYELDSGIINWHGKIQS